MKKYAMKAWTFLVAKLGRRLAEEAIASSILGALVLTVILMSGYKAQAPPVVLKTTPDTTTVQVAAGKLTPKVVDKLVYVQDKTNIDKLLAENARLKSTVLQLNETLASLTSSGSGHVTTVPVADVPPALVPPATTTPTVTQFRDWRLTFIQNGTDASYSLAQRFEVLSTIGRLADGKPFTQFKLFEVGPGDVKTPLNNVQTVSVYADPAAPHWNLHPTIQAGVALANGEKGAVVGLQAIRHGKTVAAEDTAYSLLTPVLLIAGKTKELGLLPFSVNLGQIKHSPFRDLWVSPYLGLDIKTQKVTRYGFAFTTSF